jgi:hypothetical protein
MLVRYRNGIFDENASGPLYTMGKWSTTSKASEYATFNGDDHGGAVSGTIKIDQISFLLSSSFKNQNGAITKYNFTLQRSTGRFTETYESDKSGKSENDEHSGRCVIYQK